MTFIDGSRRSFDEMMKNQYNGEHRLEFTSSNKKLKLNKINFDKYKTGNIIFIDLSNIMVYTQGRFFFDSNLNMILGANGSGKSTVLCSINIVLDGSLSNIGRASEMDHFIKKDCDHGSITITLKSDYTTVSRIFSETELASFNIKPSDKSITITRRLFRFVQKGNKKHEYYINGKKLSSDTPVKLLVKGFNIQLDNLTQFLSQERAREFSNLNEKDLLKTTLKSISIDTYNEWRNLSEVEAKKNRLEDIIREQERKLHSLQEQRSVLEEKVQENERYCLLQDEIKKYENLLTLVKYNEFRKGTAHAEEQYERLTAALELKIAEVNKFFKAEKGYDKIKDKISADISKSDKEILDYTRSINNGASEIKKLSQKADSEISSFKHFDSIKAKYNTECHKYENAIADIQQQISEFNIEDKDVFNQWKEDRMKLSSERRNLDTELQEHTNFIVSLKKKQQAADLQIKKLKNNLNDKDPLLKLPEDDQRRFRSALNAAKEQNLLDYVFPPAAACLQVTDDRYADFMNAAISRNTSLAITFAHSESKRQLGNHISSNLGLNTYLLDQEPTPNPPISLEQLKHLGFDGYVADFLEGHKGVRKMVIDKNRLFKTPVRMQDLDQNMIEKLKRLLDQNGKLIFTQVLAGNSFYRFIKSKYDGQVTVSSYRIKSGRYYRKTAGIIDDDLKSQTEEAIAQISNSILKMNDEIVNRENKVNEIRIQIARLGELSNTIVDKIKKYEIQYKTYRELTMQKERYEKNLSNTKKKIEEFSDEKTKEMKIKVIKNIFSFKINQSLAAIKPVKELSANAAESFFNRQKKRLLLQSLENEQLLNQGETKTLEREVRELETQVAESKQILEEAKNDTTRQMLEAKVQSFRKAEMKELKKLSSSIDPFSVNNVATILRSKNSDLQNLHFDSESDIKLNYLKTEIDSINAYLPTLNDDLKRTEADFTARDGALKHLVSTTISGISEKFESLFKNVGCKGKVTLSDLSKPYKEWEVEIQVSFRMNAQLQKLSGKTHSGGEQSVSTMLYLISLQRYTKAPFTVIDEINQGMDANNERKIHEILVKETCSSTDGEGSQYILITPKLLTNLYYDYGMQCNIIFAGLEMPDVNSDDLLLNLGTTPLYDLS